jgi:hypothetical protein
MATVLPTFSSNALFHTFSNSGYFAFELIKTPKVFLYSKNDKVKIMIISMEL